MRETRIHHPEPLADDAEVRLTDAARHHLSRVLRLTDSAVFTLFDGSGKEWSARLVDARAGLARTGTGMVREAESPLDLTLVQGISRGERMDWTIQKAVELGVTRIVPVATARGTVKLDAERADKRLAHWRGVVIAACEQSGRTRVPEVAPPRALDAFLAADMTGTLLALDPAATRTLREMSAGAGAPVAILVGPEGGLDEEELRAAEAAGWSRVGLGPRVLRTETAGLAAIAALQALFGDLG